MVMIMVLIGGANDAAAVGDDEDDHDYYDNDEMAIKVKSSTISLLPSSLLPECSTNYYAVIQPQ